MDAALLILERMGLSPDDLTAAAAGDGRLCRRSPTMSRSWPPRSPPAPLRPTCWRRMLRFSGLLTLALNTAGSIADRQYGTALVDTVGPALLMGWSEVGPWMLRQIHAVSPAASSADKKRGEGIRSSGR